MEVMKKILRALRTFSYLRRPEPHRKMQSCPMY
jgi:hypothetical protein